MSSRERHEIVQRASSLPFAEQLALIEDLIRTLRRSCADQGAIEQQMDALVRDPGMQRVLRNEDLVTP